MKNEMFERQAANCFACGRPVDQVYDSRAHHREPDSEEERCDSRPRKYTHLRCMYAAGHTCHHTSRVSGTGLHYWAESDAVS